MQRAQSYKVLSLSGEVLPLVMHEELVEFAKSTDNDKKVTFQKSDGNDYQAGEITRYCVLYELLGSSLANISEPFVSLETLSATKWEAQLDTESLSLEKMLYYYIQLARMTGMMEELSVYTYLEFTLDQIILDVNS